jgi:hypothetical protein
VASDSAVLSDPLVQCTVGHAGFAMASTMVVLYVAVAVAPSPLRMVELCRSTSIHSEIDLRKAQNQNQIYSLEQYTVIPTAT